MKISLNLLKLYIKYCRLFFSGHGVNVKKLMLRKCAYFGQKSTQTEKSNLPECSFSCFHGCERVSDFFKVYIFCKIIFDTLCREPPPAHVFVESLAEIDPRKVVEVVRLTCHKKQRLCDPFFRALSETHSLFRPQPQVPSFIQIDPSFRELFRSLQ